MSLNQVVKFYVRLRLGRIKTPLFHYVRFKSESVFCSGVMEVTIICMILLNLIPKGRSKINYTDVYLLYYALCFA